MYQLNDTMKSESMHNTRIIPSRDLRNNYNEVIGYLEAHDHVVITNRGRGEAVLISMADFAAYEDYLRKAGEARVGNKGTTRDLFVPAGRDAGDGTAPASIVEAVYRHAETAPDKVCLIEGDTKITYGEFFRAIAGFSRYLSENGLKKGDAVVVRTSQTIAFFAAGLAIQLAGGVFVPLEKNVSDKMFKEILEATEAPICIGARQVETIALQIPTDEALAHAEEALPAYGDIVWPAGGDLAEILFTTGTTGKSKGVMITHANNIALAQNIKFATEMGQDNIQIIPGPYNHSAPLRRYYANMYNGSTVIAIDGVIFAGRFFEAMEKHSATSVLFVPSFLTILYQITKDRIADFADQLDYVEIAGSIFPRSEKERLCALLPKTRLYDFYGCTEAGVSCTFDFNKERWKMDTVGRPTLNSVFTFFNEDGVEVATDAENPASLAYGGGILMKGYFGDPKLTANSIRKGFIVTKDLAYMDEDGYIHILGRQDDIINMGGIKIAPVEIEDAALASPDIAQAACVSASDAMFGEVPRLFIVAKNSEVFDEGTFRAFLAKRIDESKMPRSIIEIDDLPKTANGKVSRLALKGITVDKKRKER